jgi:histidinol-phosphate phosphatase family protein
MSIKQWNIDDTWTLFLDRDGVINKRVYGNYITGIDSFEFLAGAKEAITLLSSYFQFIFVVTNQQGIGKGIMTESNLLDIHTYMCDQIHLAGGKIEKCYFAPNLEGAEDDMRKPKSVMAELAKREFPLIDFHKCVMVGDTDTDIQFGKDLGMKTVRIKADENIGYDADVTVESLISFAKKIRNEL